MKRYVGHEKLTLSKDRIFSECVHNVKNGTPGGLSCVGAECGVPGMMIFIEIDLEHTLV
jgi:hypothetical protein